MRIPLKTRLGDLIAIWPLVICLLLPFSPAPAASVLQAWVQRYNGPDNDFDQVRAVAADTDGNVVVTGGSRGNLTSMDYLTIKYSADGVPLWTNRYDGTASDYDEPGAVVVDAAGNVIVTGYSLGSTSDLDMTTVAYSSTGEPLWTARYNGPANGVDSGQALAVDRNGNICVAGSSAGSGSSDDYVVVAYSLAGVPLWTNRYDGPANGSEVAYAVSVDRSNNLFVTGSSVGYGSFTDFATVAYSDAGVPLWTNRYNGPGNGSAVGRAVAVDKAGNVFVTGWSSGGGTSDDFATIAYTSAGLALWTNRYNGPDNSIDRAIAVVVDGGGNLFVTGRTLRSGSSNDVLTIAYSGAGIALWTNRYNGAANGDDRASAMAVDSGGNVFVGGYSQGSKSGYDYLTIAYSGAGVPLWTNWYDGPINGPDQMSSLAVAGNGAVVVSGYSAGTQDGYTDWDYAVVKYVSTPDVVGITNTGAASWQLACSAMPGLAYVTQFATNLTISPWFDLGTNTAGQNGLWSVLDSTATNAQRFYRLRSQ